MRTFSPISTYTLSVHSGGVRNVVEAMRTTDASTSTITTSVQTLAETNMVIVRDSGPGLDQEMAKRMFEPFFSAKLTGIGMVFAISRALVEANGGQHWIDPDARTGTKFHFTLSFAP